MGIVNKTPDSFFDGGAFLDHDSARARVDQLLREGADILDVGAESSRPRAPEVSAAEQIERLGDTIRYATARGAFVSVDTTSPEVAERAVADGARMINSIALEPAAALGEIAARSGAQLCLTHSRGSMTAMAGFSTYPEDGYDDVVHEVAAEWRAAAARALAAGLPAERLLFDPGLGFAKSAAQSLTLSARLADLKRLVAPHRVLVGPSRKSYLARAVADELGVEAPTAAERLGASVAAAVDCASRGADVLRVHDVAVVRQALAYMARVAQVAPGRTEPPEPTAIEPKAIEPRAGGGGA
jgi:dihydropteroate synthase